MKVKYLLLAALMAFWSLASAADRFSASDFELVAPEQKRSLDALIAGPRDGAMEILEGMLDRRRFDAWLGKLELDDRLQRAGEYVRFKSPLQPRLGQFAILITARQRTSQHEWRAHLPLAIEAGLDPDIAAQLAAGKRPAGMSIDEAVVYDFSTQLQRHYRVDHRAFKRALALFGWPGVIELIGVNGYYSAASMMLKVTAVPLPRGESPPLAPLQRGKIDD